MIRLRSQLRRVWRLRRRVWRKRGRVWRLRRMWRLRRVWRVAAPADPNRHVVGRRLAVSVDVDKYFLDAVPVALRPGRADSCVIVDE